jgi:hypothetical protein
MSDSRLPSSPSSQQGVPSPQRPVTPSGLQKIAGVPIQSVGQGPNLDPIGLVDAPAAPTGAAPISSKIKAFGMGGPTTTHAPFKRQPFVTGQGAIRVRSFHGRLSDEGMNYMDDKINDWLDNHQEIEVKFVTTAIGQYEGKIREPALVLNIWY